MFCAVPRGADGVVSLVNPLLLLLLPPPNRALEIRPEPWGSAGFVVAGAVSFVDLVGFGDGVADRDCCWPFLDDGDDNDDGDDVAAAAAVVVSLP